MLRHLPSTTQQTFGSRTTLITEFNHAGMALSPSTGYYGGGVPDSTTNQQGGVAIDGSGNVWVTNYADGTVTGFSPAGVALNSGFATRLGVFSPTSVAIDGSGNVWVSGMGRSLSYSPFPTFHTRGSSNSLELALQSLLHSQQVFLPHPPPTAPAISAPAHKAHVDCLRAHRPTSPPGL